jgi:hypothetical protein
MLIQIKDFEGDDMCLIYAKGSYFKRNHEVITGAIEFAKEKNEDGDYEAMRDDFFNYLEERGFEHISIEDSFEVDFF